MEEEYMAKKTTNLSDRMKRYEFVSRDYLTLKTPVIIRCDGRAFHSFARGLKKPFDAILMKSMQDTALALSEAVQGCILAYTQSDEISLVLIDYQTKDTAAWFDYNVQKCASIAASMATKYFNKFFTKYANEWIENYHDAWNTSKEDDKYYGTLLKLIDIGAEFDARVFNLPKEEVANYIYWRQDDASRNSIQMVGHAYFSNSQMHKKSNSEIQDMLMLQHNINWNNFPIPQKRGTCCVRRDKEIIGKDGAPIIRKKWVIDKEIPIFTGENRAYIEDLINI